MELTGEQAGAAPHIRFPGLFNECWLYINGKRVAHRKQGKLWWLNDYRYEWDVDLTDKLEPGNNTIALRCNCEHHLVRSCTAPWPRRPVYGSGVQSESCGVEDN